MEETVRDGRWSLRTEHRGCVKVLLLSARPVSASRWFGRQGWERRQRALSDGCHDQGSRDTLLFGHPCLKTNGGLSPYGISLRFPISFAPPMISPKRQPPVWWRR